MELGIKNKIALVTASSKGLGKASALSLASEGVKVVICSRNKQEIEKTANEIHDKTGSEILPVVCDLTKQNQIIELKKTIIESYQTIDILVNNNGGPPAGYFDDFNSQDWYNAFDLTYMSATNLIKEFSPIMLEKNWGRIITITSIAVKEPIDNLILSNSIRAALLGLSKTLARQWASKNMLVNVVCPGYILTSRVENLLKSRMKKENITYDEAYKKAVHNIPMQRIGKPNELADVITFLASEKASYMTGTVIPVDGGYLKGII